MTPDTPFGTGRPLPRPWLLAAALLLIAVGVAAAIRLRRAPPSAIPAAHQHEMVAGGDAEMPVTLGARDQGRIGITYAPVTWAPLEREVRIAAQVVPDETRLRTVAPLVEGWVERLHVDFTGQVVRAGEPLFALYAPMVVAGEEELVLAQRLQHDVAAAGPEARANAALTLDAARRRLAYWGVPADEIRRVEASGRPERTVTFRSPYSGVVVEKPVTAGQRLMPGEVAYRIADLGRVWLEGEVFEQDLPAVRPGLEVQAEFTALPGEVRRGRIAYIVPLLDPETRTTRIRVELDNPGLRLRPGMFATVRFVARGAPALSVPRSAVLSTGERDLVFLRHGDRFMPRRVELGATTDDRVEIRSGLARGDTVVASGTFLLDAESDLGSLLGGMGNMPGMDMAPPAAPKPPGDSVKASHAMPGMGHAATPATE